MEREGEPGLPRVRGTDHLLWLRLAGHCLGVDTQRLEEGQPGVLMFEPGTAEILEIPANIETFHDALMIENPDAALTANIYVEDWLAAGGAQPAFDQCIGYKKPLFLGGEDDISNQELIDLEVYWHIMGQVIAKVTASTGDAGSCLGLN